MGNATVGNSFIFESRRDLSGTYYVGEEKLNEKRSGRKQETEDSSWYQDKGEGNISNGEQNLPGYKNCYFFLNKQ